MVTYFATNVNRIRKDCPNGLIIPACLLNIGLDVWGATPIGSLNARVRGAAPTVP